MTKEAVHISQLELGDIVRPARGGLQPKPGAPALAYRLADGSQCVVENTRGWRSAPIGGPDDFRQGYDAMTVVKVTDNYVDFVRPYYHVYPDGTVNASLEQVNHASRDHGGLWYELL